ncbi:lactadherin-like [Asterias amurensis]|uniref:lactadherin-like n=1 Tax=Asterias amurensis TaxID=7602 RepID=UPI003AB4B51A
MSMCGVHVADSSNGHGSMQHLALSTFKKKCRSACSIEGPLGMENKVIPDAAITASSTYENMIPTHGPQRSRLNTIGQCAAWGPSTSDTQPWIQVDLGSVSYITALITQGRGNRNVDQWVTAYNVKYGLEVEPTKYVTDVYGVPTEFVGNTDANSTVTTRFETALVARFLRILPKKNCGYYMIRFEVIGCMF